MKHLLVPGATQTLQGLQGVDARVQVVLTPHPSGPVLPSKVMVLSIDSEKGKDTFSKIVFNYWKSVIVLCFVVCYFMSILVLQSS